MTQETKVTQADREAAAEDARNSLGISKEEQFRRAKSAAEKMLREGTASRSGGDCHEQG